MKLIEEADMPYNSGKGFVVKKEQRIRLLARSHIDFIPFNLDDMRERFDQGRTKAHNGKIFISTGDKLYTKFANPIMTIIEDTYPATHDLQYGMCSKVAYDKFWELISSGDPFITETWTWLNVKKREDLPDHGCWENIQDALEGYDIAPENIPSPINIFQGMEIVMPSGKMIWRLKENEPPPGQFHRIDLRAEINCHCAVSACPAMGTGQGIKVQVFDE